MGITGSAATVVPLADSQKKEEEEGWALRATKKAKAFSKKQRMVVGNMLMVRDNSHRKRFCLHENSKFLFTAGKMQKLRSPVSFRQRL